MTTLQSSSPETITLMIDAPTRGAVTDYRSCTSRGLIKSVARCASKGRTRIGVPSLTLRVA